MRKILIVGLTLVFLLALGLGSKMVLAQNTITFGDLTWNSSQVHNRIAGFIIKHGYDYKVDYMYGQTQPIILGLRNKDVDIVMEAWTHNWEDPYFKGIKKGEIIDLGANYPPSPQGWYVPTYLIEGDEERGIEPMAPDLKSVEDLAKYWKLFKENPGDDKARFYNGPISWKVYDTNVEKLKGYGLADKFKSYNPGSQTSLDVAVIDAYREGEPIFFYYWEPTWLMGSREFTRLNEPSYSLQVWNQNKACSFPPVKVNIAVDSDLAETDPRVVTFLANYKTTLEQNNEILSYMKEEDVSPEETAIWFLKEYREVWQEWFRDVDEEIVQKVEQALKKR